MVRWPRSHVPIVSESSIAAVGRDVTSRNSRNDLHPRVAARGKLLLMPLRDTTPQAQMLQLSIHRHLSPSQRLENAVEMSNFTHQLAATTMRKRLPGCSDEEAMRRLADALYSRSRRRS